MTGRSETARRGQTDRKRMDRITNIITVGFCLMLFITSRFWSIKSVVGRSMEPTYKNGDLLLATKEADPADISYGSIVVAENGEGEIIIKRVIGLPGDTVRITDGIVYVNGEPEQTDLEKIIRPGAAADGMVLAEDEYFLLGDNRNNSNDSRSFGPVKERMIQNIVLFKLF